MPASGSHRRPTRRDDEALFAALPVWAPFAAVAMGDAAVVFAFAVFHWPTTLRASALELSTAFFGITGIGGLLERARRRRRLSEAASLDALRAMSWDAFEHLVMSAYAARGWSASLTGRGADGGADVILERHHEKVLVQCKHWKVRQVSVRTVRELHSVMVTEGATGGIVVTSGTFSHDALATAKTVGIECLDGGALLALVPTARNRQEAANPTAIQQPTTADASPTCPKCGSTMARRRSQRGPFWGCSTYPRCRAIIHIAGG